MPTVTTDVTFLTVTLYLLDLAIKVVAVGLVPEGLRPSSASAWLRLSGREQPALVQLADLFRAAPAVDHQPYFVPDESLLYAITTAAQRGVDVEQAAVEALRRQCHASDVGFAVST